MMRVRRRLTRSPGDEAVWRAIHIHAIDEHSPLLAIAQSPLSLLAFPQSRNQETTLFAATPEQAEAMALEYLSLAQRKVLYASSNRRCSSDCMSRRPSIISRT
jgi:hypothetical protein